MKIILRSTWLNTGSAVRLSGQVEENNIEVTLENYRSGCEVKLNKKFEVRLAKYITQTKGWSS